MQLHLPQNLLFLFIQPPKNCPMLVEFGHTTAFTCYHSYIFASSYSWNKERKSRIPCGVLLEAEGRADIRTENPTAQGPFLECPPNACTLSPATCTPVLGMTPPISWGLGFLTHSPQHSLRRHKETSDRTQTMLGKAGDLIFRSFHCPV